MRQDSDLDRLLPPGGALAGRLFSRLVGAASDDVPLEPGTLVGDWRVGKLLGRGGSSMVYLAERADGQFEQQVALKIVRPNQHLIEHFRRERQILAELRHPAIAQLIDGGQMDGGRLWFAMEPVFGERIDRYVALHRLPLDDRLALFDAVCEAVAYAHSRLLIHRDIKPGNLLVDELGRPRLLDFGIATSSELDTSTGVRAMTPTYASPEQRTGGTITTASDIYQLGLLLRELVLPHGAPCETLPREPRAIVVAELAAIIACATEDAPGDRYPTVSALRADLAALRQRRPVSVIAGFRYPAARFLERHAMPSAIALVAMAAVLSTGWIAAHRVQIERDQARSAAARAKATSDFLVSLFSVSDPGENRGEKLTANQILARGAEQLERSSADPAQAAAVAHEIGRVYMELGEYARSRELLTKALAVAEARLPAGSRERVALRILRGRAAYFSGAYDVATDDFSAARRELASRREVEDRATFEGTVNTEESQLLRRMGQFDAALGMQTKGIEELTSARDPDIRELGFAWNNLGLIQHFRHDYPAAIDAYERSIGIYREQYGGGDIHLFGPRINLAESLMQTGDFDRAETILVEDVARLKAIEDWPSTRLAHAIGVLSLIRVHQGRYAEAEELARESDERIVRTLGPEHNYRGYALIELGQARLGSRNYGGAIEAFAESLRIRRRAFGDEHPDVALSWQYLGHGYLQAGDAVAAESAYLQAVGISERMLPRGHPQRLRTRLDRADALFALGRLADAGAEATLAEGELELVRGDAARDRARLLELRRKLSGSTSD